MAKSEVLLTVQDGNLGLSSGTSDSLHIKLGVATGGTPNVLAQYGDKRALATALLSGPAAEAAAFSLSTGNSVVGVMPTAVSSAGAAGATSHTGPGLATVTASGSPLDAYQVVFRVLKPGVVGTATFQLSLDGGRTYGQPSVTSASYVVLGTGLTLALDTAAGPFLAGESYAIGTTAPLWNQAGLLAAFDELLAGPVLFRHVHVVGSLALTDQMALAAALNTRLESAVADGRDTSAIVEISGTDADITTALASFSGKRVNLVAGRALLASGLRTTLDYRSAAWPLSSRIAQNAISRDAAAFADGPLLGVLGIERDEAKTPGLDDARVSTLRTYKGEPGYYVTHALLASSPGSDFKHQVTLDVVNKACTVARSALRRYLNTSVRVDKTGKLLPVDAAAIDAFVTSRLVSELSNTGDVSAIAFKVDRAANVLSTEEMHGDVVITPLGYFRQIRVTVGLFNPALAAA